MEWILVVGLIVVVIAAMGYIVAGGRRRTASTLADARAEAQRWHERLGGQIANLPAGPDPAARQALVDAGERYNAAGAQLASAQTPRQYELARETALEGLSYVQAARRALGLDPGPALPPLEAARGAGQLTKERSVEVQGHRYAAGPDPGPNLPYYYPGGMVAGRPVPRGWYSEPWWKTALVAGAWGIGGLLLFNALFDPVWGDPGYDAGFVTGDGYDVTGDELGDGDLAGGADGDLAGGADGDLAGGADGDLAGDTGGDFGGADLGGGDFGGGDFGGGDF